MNPGHRDVVQQAGEHHLVGEAVVLREIGALQQVRRREVVEAAPEKVEQGRLVGQRRQAGVFAHEHAAAESVLAESAVPVGQVVEEGLADDSLAELLHLAVLEFVGALGHGGRVSHRDLPARQPFEARTGTRWRQRMPAARLY